MIRGNHAQNLRYGVHEMYTSDTLVVNNTVRNSEAGIVVMTRPTDRVPQRAHSSGDCRALRVIGAGARRRRAGSWARGSLSRYRPPDQRALRRDASVAWRRTDDARRPASARTR
ncbi:hypothetical protein JT689_01105 (plasmid) [Halobacterium sp. GSL-19]|nr:hypothetical protein [Halobacterium salinarum]MCF2168484.1 hypothetical protein [Halobacterium salinarum]MCF2207128.1 hypothetical protein [Halobacterium salinarum]MCF2240346.1 hypothetical protein [Halobacterium salinarum]QRY21553.1 hypothetical protein JT689_01105 [Halobacterium sp. GSL-19]